MHKEERTKVLLGLCMKREKLNRCYALCRKRRELNCCFRSTPCFSQIDEHRQRKERHCKLTLSENLADLAKSTKVNEDKVNKHSAPFAPPACEKFQH